MDGVNHHSMLTEPRLHVQKNQAECKERSFHIVAGICGKLRTLKVNNASIDTLKAALLERMYFCKVGDGFESPPTPNEEVIRSRLKEFKYKLLGKIGTVDSKLSPEEFVDMFRGRKKTIYTNALTEYYETGITRNHARSCSFVKMEKVNPEKAPRCIQPRHPVYNIGVGCYLKHLEHRIYRAISKVFGDEDVVMKGFDVREIGRKIARKWNTFNDPIAIGLDATKFDMHVSAEMLQWEHSIYLNLYKGDKELRRLLSWQVDNEGVGYCDDGKLRYKVRGRRFSGDMNTALGNCIIMCAMVYAYSKERGVDIKLVNNGDDCLVMMERKHEHTFKNGLDDWFMAMGFRMTVEQTVDDLAEAEFCQMRVLYDGRDYVSVRNFDTAREKDSISLLPINNARAMQRWLYAIGECGLALTSGVPIFQSMYECYMRNGIPSNVDRSVQMQTGMMHLRRNLESKSREITPTIREWFFAAWGYTPDEQVALEQYYNQLVLHYTDITVDNFFEISNAPF